MLRSVQGGPVPTYVDTHCHLDHHFDVPAAEQVEAARAAGVGTMITVGTDMASSTQAVQTANRFAGVWAVVGIHPNDAMEATPAVLGVIDRLASQDVVVGIGETGLDYYRDHTTPQQQESSFRRHIAMAKEHDRALVIHCREAWDECLAVLASEGAPERVVMHCFSGDERIAQHCAEEGYFMSFAGNVTFKNAEELRAAAAVAPSELLLTETDSPYLTPVPNRGKPNDPSHIPFVLRQLAEVKDVGEDELAATVLANARRAFALPDDASRPGAA
ncbi:MAG: TatD family hydrolase [Actinobacteria bacterium]|nr:TatD family hydrolase [Actinomycetota bacterium]